MAATAREKGLFPIQKEYRDSALGEQPETEIPWWLAEEAYAQYASYFGGRQTIDRMAERGGFGRNELLDLLAGGNGNGDAMRAVRAKRRK